ncbi:MAG: carbon monoxide dehydrogenase [Paracoccaceae bacterium]|nr:MAG: carbon monoxide dehydrogenase [Paracoccaceae bacterium]
MKFGIGQAVTRLEDPRLLTGAGRYVDDIRLEGTLHAHVLRSPVAHGRITRLDVTAARALAGVHLVLTHAETADLGPIAFRMALKQADGSDFAPVRMPRLADGVVRFVGQPVAFIVADSRDIARDAAELIELEIESLPVVVTPEAALAPDAPLLHDCAPDNIVYRHRVGDAEATEAAFARAAHVVRTRVVNQRLAVAPLEPRSFLVRHDPASDGWEFWMANQGAHSARDNLAAALGVDPARIRAHTPDVGGGFGMKLMDFPEYPLCARAAQLLDRPVKWIADRSESFLSDTQGRDLVSEVEAAFDAQHRLIGMRARSVSNLGAYCSSAGPGVHTVFSAGLLGGMYDCPAMLHEVTGVLTNTTPVDAYRGAGRPEVIHVTEQVMEAAAEALGVDPVALRRKNLVRPEQLPYRTQGGLTFDSLDPERNLDSAVRRIDLAGFPARRAEAAARGRLRGIAVAYYYERTGGAPHENAAVTLGEDGRLRVAVGTQSSGQGHATAWAQILSDRLGLPAERITLLDGDTALLPRGGGTGGSRSLIMAGRVLIRAAEDIIAQGRERAAEHLEVAPADLEFDPGAGGLFRVVGTDRAVALTELAARAPIRGWGEVDDTVPSFPNGCHAAEVEIDPDTGAVRLLRHVVADDFGVIVNPLLAAGQVHGGIAQGVGQVLCEAVTWDDDGQPLTGSLMDYALPRAADLPFFETEFNEIPCRTNPLGVKGCGEAGSVGAIPAVALAIRNALRHAGVTQLPTPPYTPHKLWSALRSASGA